MYQSNLRINGRLTHIIAVDAFTITHCQDFSDYSTGFDGVPYEAQPVVGPNWIDSAPQPRRSGEPNTTGVGLPEKAPGPRPGPFGHDPMSGRGDCRWEAGWFHPAGTGAKPLEVVWMTLGRVTGTIPKSRITGSLAGTT